MVVKVRFDGKVFVPEQPIQLPAGSVAEVIIPTQEDSRSETSPGCAPHLWIAELADQFPFNEHFPTDGAAQHDHYLYGTPKKAKA